jgi:acetylornithine/N-succinyldiaminopimelate aminotransferase
LKAPLAEVVNACFAEKLLAVVAGDNVMRLIPPLNVTDEELGDAVERISKALGKLGL